MVPIRLLNFLKANHEVVVFDNLIYGHKEAITCPLIVGDLLNKEEINKVFSEDQFDGVIHFAAYAQAGESMKDPQKYFENNIQGGLNLLEAMRKNNVLKIVFSSPAPFTVFLKNFLFRKKKRKNRFLFMANQNWLLKKYLNGMTKFLILKMSAFVILMLAGLL